MAEVFSPLRTERLFDPETGNITIRFATYLDDLANSLNQVTVTTEIAEGALTEASQSFSLLSDQAKDIAALDQLSVDIGRINARISSMEKQISELYELIMDQVKDPMESVFDKRLKEVEALV